MGSSHIVAQNPIKPITKDLSTLLLDKDTYVPVYNQKSVITDNLIVNQSPTVLDKKSNISLNDSTSSASTGSTLNNSVTTEIQPMTNETNITPAIEIMETINKTLTSDNDEDDDAGMDDDDEDDDDNQLNLEYTDDDLDEALESQPDESTNSNKDESELSNNSNMLIMDDFSEGHYMPMTPKKSILSLSESNIFISLKLTDLKEIDESTYVEMTRNGLTTSILADNYKSDYDLVCINSGHKRTESEPVYMELSQLKNSPANKNIESVINNGKSTIKKSTLKRYSDLKKRQKKSASNNSTVTITNLPDILKPSQNVVTNSDSSDADDESSKEPDALKLRSRSRFSLSDTFRPASYYLGASTPLAECPDSSDSEIVSPPPIPSSPPPLDDLKTEEIFSSENYDTIKRRQDKTGLNLSYDQIPKIHSSSSSLNSIRKDNIKTSRLSLPDHFLKHQPKPNRRTENNESDYGFLDPYNNVMPHKLPSESSYSYHTDNSSITSSDYDLYKKVKMQSPSFGTPTNQLASGSPSPSGRYQTTPNDSETDSIELRSANDQDLQRQLRRRPLSEESFNEIELMGEKFSERIVNTDLDQYLNKLQNNDPYVPYTNSDNNWIKESKLYDIPFIKPPKVFRNESDDNFYGNISYVSSSNENLLNEFETPSTKAQDIDNKFRLGDLVTNSASTRSNICSPNGIFYDSLEDKSNETSSETTLSPLKEKNLTLHDLECKSKDLLNSYTLALPAQSFTIASSSIDLDQQTVCSTEFNMGQCSLPIPPMHSRNNSNVSDQSAPYYYADLPPPIDDKQQDNVEDLYQPKLNNQRDIEQKRTGISHIHNPINSSSPEVRSLSMELLNVTEKDRFINRKNLFEAGELRMEKNVCKELSTGYAGNKLYGKQICPIKEDNRFNANVSPPKSNNYTAASSTSDYHQPMNTQLTSIAPIVDNSHQLTDITTRSNESAGDLLWEEDELWSESLRRVSHRHARSLDALDRLDGASSSVSSITSLRAKNADKEWAIKTPIQTQPLRSTKNEYVNVQLSKKSSKMIFNSRNPNEQFDNNRSTESNADENDVYVQLAMDQRECDVYDRLREDNIPHSRKSIEINREIIRQWDSMSSGLMKSGGNGGVTSTGVGTGVSNDKNGVGLNKNNQQGLMKMDTDTQGSTTSSNVLGRTHTSKTYHVV